MNAAAVMLHQVFPSRKSFDISEISMRRAVLCLFLFVALASEAATPQPSSIALAISGTRIVASGVTPRGSVYFLGVARERRRFTPVLRRIEKTVVDDDGDGTVVFDYGSNVAAASVWVAVDMVNGHRGTATPNGDAEPLVLSDDPVVINNGQLKKVVIALDSCHLLLVRPGVGAWGQVLVRGNRFDNGESASGGVSADVSRSLPAPGVKVTAPDHFEKDDVIVLIDPLTLQVFTAAVGEKS